jgi:hypothetical protein
MVRKFAFGLVLALVAGSVGCHCCGERCPQRAVAAPPAPCCPPAGGVAVPAAPAPVPAVPAPPAGAYYGP